MTRNRLLVIACLCSSASTAYAGTACPPLTRVGFSDLGSASFRENGQIKGLTVDIASELARRTGCKFEFHWYPRQRLFVELSAGRIDMTLGAIRAPERDAYATYLPYAWLQYDLVLRTTADSHYNSLTDFVERGSGRLNVTRGVVYDSAVETQLAILLSRGRLELVNDYETVFGKLEMGRADGTLATPPIYTRYVKDRHLKNLSVIPMPEAAPRFTGIYVSRQTVPTAARLRYAAALKDMIVDQQIARLYERYFDEPTVRRIFRPGTPALLTALSNVE